MPASRLHNRPHFFQMTNPPDTLNPLVLIVESDDDSREMFRILLKNWGYQTVESKNGEDSIEMAICHRPNVILMDTWLSNMDGLTTLRRLREIEILQGVPIVFISGHAQPEFRRFALTVGGDEFLVKPVDFNRLEIILKRFTGKGNSKPNFGGITV